MRFPLHACWLLAIELTTVACLPPADPADKGPALAEPHDGESGFLSSAMGLAAEAYDELWVSTWFLLNYTQSPSIGPPEVLEAAPNPSNITLWEAFGTIATFLESVDDLNIAPSDTSTVAKRDVGLKKDKCSRFKKRCEKRCELSKKLDWKLRFLNCRKLCAQSAKVRGKCK